MEQESVDVIHELGALAFASRLKRLSERLMQEAGKVYRSQQVSFEPRWFPIFYLLNTRPPMPLTEVARALGLTHPAINQIARDLTRKGLLRSVVHSQDRRKRLLTLTEKGRRLLPIVQPVWEQIEKATNELLSATGQDVLAVIDALERQLNQNGVAARVRETRKKAQLEEIQIEDFTPKRKNAFKSLNYEWLKKYFSIEPSDRAVLSDPENSILRKGGFIFFARLQNAIVGTCALIKHDAGTFELAKMAVNQKAQGRQVGKKLALAAIDRAGKSGAVRIILETNRKLGPAVGLYTSMGFTPYAPEKPSQYRRTNLFMELKLPR